MANTKIYKKGGLLFIDVDGSSEKLYLDSFEINIVDSMLIITQTNSTHNRSIYTLISDVQDINGNLIGDLTAVEEYIAELKITPTANKNTSISSGSIAFDIPNGNILGVVTVNKFGTSSDVTKDTQEDVWDGGGTYPFPTTADITHVSQVSDQVAMRGGTIEVQGLDINWILTVQTVDLDLTDTTTEVALTIPLIRVFRAKVLENVVANSNIHICNAGDTIHYAIIRVGMNQTLMAIYTVPAGKTALLTRMYSSVVDSTNKTPTSTRFSLWMADRKNGYEFQIKNAYGIPTHGSFVNQAFNPYQKINEKTDIKIKCMPADENADVAAGFDLYLIDEDESG